MKEPIHRGWFTAILLWFLLMMCWGVRLQNEKLIETLKTSSCRYYCRFEVQYVYPFPETMGETTEPRFSIEEARKDSMNLEESFPEEGEGKLTKIEIVQDCPNF